MFEVGEKVISDYFGEGRVVEVNTKLDYPVLVRFIKSSSLKGFTEYGLYKKSNKDTDKDNIKKVDNYTEESNYKKTMIKGFGHLIELDNGICIYHPNQGQPFQVYPKSTNEGLSWADSKAKPTSPYSKKMEHLGLKKSTIL